MHRVAKVAAIVAVCLSGGTAFAQQEPATKEEVEEVKGVVEGLTESTTEMRGILDALRKIKLSGYIQVQYRLGEIDGGNALFSGGNFPANTHHLFQLRRGRFKVAYDNVLTQAVLQVDIVPAGLALKDAYISVTEPWMQSFGLQAGVFNRPFGYEVSYSSGSRESPERARAIQTLFPGERDLGIKVFFAPQLGALRFYRAELALVNGAGPVASEYDNFKDLLGRIGAQFPFDDEGLAIDAGVSGYVGNIRNDTRYLYTPGSPVSSVNGFVLDSSAANKSDGVDRNYVGLDAQVYYDSPFLGGVVLRGEFVTGTQPGTRDTTARGGMLASVSPVSQPAGPLYRRNFSGWYVTLVQNLADVGQVVLKYDFYDPNTSVTPADFVAGSNLSAADVRYSTFGFGYVHHLDGNIKATAYYEVVKNETLPATSPQRGFAEDIKDNVFTLRLQYRW